jgi:HK97 family phage major capsid protein
MNKKKLLDLIAKKESRKAEIGKKANATEDIKELRAINAELEDLNGELAELRGILAGASDDDEDEDEEEYRDQRREEQPEQRGGSPVGRSKILATYGLGGGQASDETKREKEEQEKWEKRGADLKAKRSVDYDLDEVPELRATTIGGGTLINETKYKRTLAPTFNEVSRVIDTVNAVPLMGGEAYEAGFEISSGEGDYTTEEGNYTETDPVFGYVSIGKAKITAYAEMTDESMKLPNIDYQSRVRASIVKALRKKISKQILVGAGGANAITGIFNAPTNVIPTSTDLAISEIDADTLDTIVISYGGDEEVEGLGYLVLNKKDLAAFAAVRDANGRKLYKIKTNGNTGTISSDESFEVPFIINSACPALSASGTTADTYCMTYGMMMGYEMPIFSALTVEESRDFKFRTGHIAYRGSVWAGGNVAMYKGFIRVKKA